MALTLHLKYVENLKGRAERLAKVSFRGLSHYTKTIENAEDSVVFDEYFEWPVARPVEAEEVIDIQIFNYNKYLSNRLVGTFRMILQELIEVGNTKINDCLLDTNNVVMKTTVTFELSYNAPDGSVGLWQKGGFEKLRSNDLRRGLSAEEQQEELDKFETSSMMDFDEKYGDSQSMHSLQSAKSGGKGGSMLSLVSTKSSKSTKSTKSNKSHGSRALSSVMKMAMLMRQKPAGDTNDEDNRTLTGNEDLDPDSSDLDAKAAEVASMLAAHNRNVDDEPTGNLTVPASLQAKKGKATLMSDDNLMKAQDFQVCVTIIEARQLAGLNMDPVVCVQVGDQRKYTSVKESTNCPYYNEYFVFDFHMPPLMLFDKIISLTVCQSGRIMKTSRVMGSYKLDVSTVYAQQDHQFYHKWAMLMDPDDINGGIKGYLKCDIAVIGKGDSVKVPPKSDKDDDDIEANLLLPDGVPADRQKARYVIKLYRAEGLPKMNTGIMANVKKAFTGEKFDLTDPYVEVNFAGHKGKTSVRKGCYEPVWNEQVVFTEMFPPLCRRIKVQLRDSDSVNDDNIGTHYIDLSAISNEGEKGFLPTYGPAWVNLYGSTRYYQLLEKHGHLNDGLGEGVSFRGRLLIAVKTEIIDGEELGATQVETEPAQPISENAAGHKDEYFLFGSFIEATMIDRKVGDKPVHFEVSVGNAGNVLDGYNAPCRHSMDSDSDGEEGSDREDDKLTSSIETPQWVSTTPAAKPLSKDNCYFHLPFYENKPCVYAKDMFEDHRRRMYNSNIIDKICEKLDDGLAEAQVMIEEEQPFPEVKLRTVFEELGQGCSKFVSLVKGTGGGSAAGKTKLDKERHKLLVRELDQMSTLARTMKATVSKHNMREKLKAGMQYLTKLKGLSREPQHALPDIFIWMISGNKRIAYQRLPARHVVYSIVDEERGKDCGKVITLLLRLPGKKATGSSGWTIQAKLQVFLWLGLSKHKKDFLKGLPKGYDETRALKQASKPSAVPPPFIHYKERQFFQLRAHMYQARQLIGSDASGLSDPFARIAFADQSMATQVIDQTLSPTWDEMLVMKEVVIFGVMDEIVSSPPTIVVEVFDQDKVGKSEFIGRALCKPVVKLSTESYEPPKFPPRLEWWDIFRGLDRAGELLATFELLQKPFEERDLKAAYLTPPYARKTIGLMSFAEQRSETPEIPSIDVAVNRKDKGPILPVPKGIRPILSKHRIEVLFWGVRDLKRIQLQSVDHPRIDIECAGHVLSSSIILNCKKNPNFNVPVKYFDVELPENELYCPPITIRCVDCRSFGRFTLVGTHVISNIHKFTYVPTTKQAKCAMQRLFPMKGIDSVRVIQTGSPVSVKSEDVAITVDENLPLIHKDQCITIDVNTPSSKDPQKTQDNKKKGKKGEVEGEDEPDMDALDWWSKYFASVETMIRDDQEVEEDHGASEDVFNVKLLEAESKAASDREGMTHAHHNPQNANGSYGSLPNGAKEVEIKQAKKFEKEAKKNTDKEKKATGTPAVASPKTQKRKEKQTSSTAQLKGFFKKIKNLVKKEPEAEEELLIETLVVYPNELESQPQFEGFNDWLHTFELYRGKNTGNDEPDENRVVGKFKGSMKIYKIPLPPDIEDTTVTGGDPAYGLFQGLPSNEPVKILVRVYVVKANDLHPADINGKADPYLVLRLGSKSQNDKDNYISKQLNPVFGKCFEFEATFPMESLLTVQVFDWDLIGVDDLIGESKIDLENRYYSRHRATCGLGQKYELHGYNAWRDPQKPTQVLGKMCKDGKVDGPHYQPGKVRIANRIFMAPMEIEDENAKKAALAKAARKAARNPRVEGVQNPTFEMEDANNNATTKKKKKNTKPATNSSAQPNGQPSNSQPPNGEIEFKPGAKREGKGDDDKDGGHVENDKDKNNKPGTTNDANKNQNAKDKNNDDGVKKATDEHLALAALNNWCEIPKVGGHLVQEHVETRPLFHPEKPGIEQGKLEMFVDMFPMDMPPPGPPVDISPRKPKGFELRCIIWNTDDVVLEDDAFFTGEKMSDIYVKGWIKGSDDMQSTDIHYRSLTGEGNFNWRFVFPFDYLVAEEKIVISRKETLFSWDETESKIPARLNLQVWDADHFSADDFLGSLTLDLNRFPRGAKSAKKCTLDMLKNDGSVPQMSLFKHKRVKGWWPFHVKNEGSEELELTGKVEAELHLMTADEAEKHPAGLGRSEPEPLEKPNRPDASFMWFMNPFKSLKHILWNNYKWLILKILLFILLVLLIGLFFYSMPGYLVKKMFNVRPDSSFMWFMNPFKSLKHILWNNYKWLILKILLFILLVLLIGLFFYSMPGYAVKKMFNARPDSSFMWFMNPFKSLRYILWHNYKWVIIKILLFLLLIILIGLFFYSMPGYTVKKMFNV